MKPLPTTERGRRSRMTIIAAASELMHERGLAAPSMDDVLAAGAAALSADVLSGLAITLSRKDGHSDVLREHRHARAGDERCPQLLLESLSLAPVRQLVRRHR
jgi:hypothetical protein